MARVSFRSARARRRAAETVMAASTARRTSAQRRSRATSPLRTLARPICHRGPVSAPKRPRPRAASAGIFATTLLALLSVGAVLPVLPRYVRGPLGEGDLAVGIVIGAYAVTGLIGRPFAGRLADTRGRRPAVVLGSLLAFAAGL